MLLLLATIFTLAPALRNLRLDALSRAELSPIQAATLVAEGKLSQVEADRLSGRSDLAGALPGEGRPVGPRNGSASP